MCIFSKYAYLHSMIVCRSINKNVNKLEIELSVMGYDKRHDTKRPKGKSKYYVSQLYYIKYE